MALGYKLIQDVLPRFTAYIDTKTIYHICLDVRTNEWARCKHCLSHTPSVALEVWECHHFLDGLSLGRKTETQPVTRTISISHIKPVICLCLFGLSVTFVLYIHAKACVHTFLCFEKNATPPTL